MREGLGTISRHIERHCLLAFMVPIDSMDWQGEYEQLRQEIAAYSAELAQMPHCVVFTKMDLLGESEPPPIDAPDAFGIFAISSAARLGLDDLLTAWWKQLLEMRKQKKGPSPRRALAPVTPTGGAERLPRRHD